MRRVGPRPIHLSLEFTFVIYCAPPSNAVAANEDSNRAGLSRSVRLAVMETWSVRSLPHRLIRVMLFAALRTTTQKGFFFSLEVHCLAI